MSKRIASLLRAACAALLLAAAGAPAAPVISWAAPLTTAPPEVPALNAGSFLLPVLASGAQALQQWQFDLVFDPAVVQVVAGDPFSVTPGLYGARFDAADDASLSFLLSGFVFNDTGRVDDIAGFYPLLADGVTGDGTLAYVKFAWVPGRENDDPGFAITGIPTVIPEPAAPGLVATALLLAAVARRRSIILQQTPA